MEISYLGPLEASKGGRAAPLGGPKQRLVLAHLLIHANEVVPTRRLIEDIWGDDPPPAARNSLHSYISHLRGALGADRIESHGDGYLLRVERDDVDAFRFEALARSGHRLLGRDPEAAAETLREALGLWRGSPFTNGPLPRALQIEADRLEQLRMAVTEDRIEAELERGQHNQLTGELEALTAAHPLRERLWSQLMLALYRSGRQAEALAAFERARLLLAEELGIDPSPDLQTLHGRILRQDPGLQPGVTALRGYRLLERLGSGPSTAVWHGTQPGTDREVAVKAFHPQLANDASFIRTFEAQIHAFSRVEHPHVVPLYDFWREPDGGYIVMRLLRGGSLRSVLDRSGRLRSGAARRTAEQVTQALAAVHQQGLLHAGVRSSNVLLDEQGNAYLAELDIVRQTRANTVTSRDHARSDGQVEEPLTPATDVRALGLLLAEIIQEPTPAVGAVIARATADDPGDRFTDAQEMVPALCAALAEVDAVATTAAVADGVAARGTPPVAPAPSEMRNPYKGLRPFTEADLGDFFGREVMTARLLDRLREPGPDARFLAVVGPSGSGKSSVVRAGLVPAIRVGALDATVPWFVVHMAPGAYPYEELEAALLRVAVEPPASLIEQLERDRLGILRAVKRILPDEQGELVLIVDQFEEIFTLVDDEERRRSFLEALTTALTDPRSRLRVVVTLRADLYDRPLRYRGLADLVRARTEALVPLTVEELERAITGPAERVGAHIGPGLVARMVSDVSDQPGALPLLQYALTEMFERRRDATIDAASYEAIGGVSGALAKRAEDTYDSLAGPAQDAARQFLLRLVVIEDGDTATRCRTLRSELRSLAPDPQHADVAIDAFGEARLLAFDRDVETRAPTVEVAHEALLSEWDRLRDWIDDARDDLRIERRLASAAREWLEAGRDPSFLVTGSRLDQLEVWRDRADLSLTAVEHEFLVDSLAERARGVAEEEARREHEAELERRSIRRLRALVAVLGVAALVATGLTIFGFEQWGQAHSQGARAEAAARVSTARGLASAAVANLDVDPERSILLALEAIDQTRSVDGVVLPEAEESLHEAVASSRIVLSVPGLGGTLAWSPAGDIFVSEGAENSGIIDIRDAETGESLRSWHGHDVDINDVTFSADGALLATTGDDGAARVWDPYTGEEVGVIEGPPDSQVWGPSFSPDGSTLAAAWPMENDVRFLEMESGAVEDLDTLEEWYRGVRYPFRTSFSPDGSRLAVATHDASGSGVVFDLRTRELLHWLTGHDLRVNDVGWSPDGRWVSTSSDDLTVRIWDGESGRLRFTLFGHTGPVVDMDWAPDGERLVTGSAGGTAKVWEVTDRGTREILTLSAQETRSGVQGVAFSPDGTQVLTGDQEITAAKIWDVSIGGDAQVANLPADPSAKSGVAFTPDGRNIATAPAGESVVLWDLDSGARRRDFEAGDGLSSSLPRVPEPSGGGSEVRFPAVEVASDGRAIAAADGSRALVWDLETGEEEFTLLASAWIIGRVAHLAWSPDGSKLAMSNEGRTVRIVDQAGNRVGVVEEDPGFGVGALAFDPDGRRLATAGWFLARSARGENRVRIWNWEEGRPLAELSADAEAIAFDGTGRRLVTAESGGLPAIWDVTSGERLVTLVGHTGGVLDVAFSPDDSVVATAGLDGTVRLWDPETGSARLVLRGHKSLVGDIAFSPDGRMLASSSTDGTARVWALHLDDLIEIARGKLTRSLSDEECRQYLRVDACPAVVDR